MGEISRANGRFHDIPQRANARHAGQKPELRFRCATLVERPGEDGVARRARPRQLDSHRTRPRNRFILRIGDDNAHRRRRAAQIGLLGHHVDHRRSQNLRDGVRALNCSAGIAGIKEAVVNAMPHQVFGGEFLVEFDVRLPRSLTRSQGEPPLRPSQYAILRIQNFNGENSSTSARCGIGYLHMQRAL